MMTVRLTKPHTQNGEVLPPGTVCRMPYRLGLAMMDKGMCVRADAPHERERMEEARALANADKLEAAEKAKHKATDIKTAKTK